MKTRIIKTVDGNKKDMWQIWEDIEGKSDEEVRQAGGCLATGLYSEAEATKKQSEIENS